MLAGLESWDVVLLAIAGYIAVVTLVRMMAYHHYRLVTRLQAELELARHRNVLLAKQRQREEKAKKRAAAQDQAG